MPASNHESAFDSGATTVGSLAGALIAADVDCWADDVGPGEMSAVCVWLAAVGEAVLAGKAHPAVSIDARMTMRTEAFNNFPVSTLTSFIACFAMRHEIKENLAA